MKTRDRILQTSLALFNEEGEAEQSAVDISNALEISPGNLYYHFKGKDAIIRALFNDFEEELRIILRGSESSLKTLDDHWIYLYILLEEIYDFRFFYRNLGILLDRYPDLATRFRALSAEVRQTVQRVLQNLTQTGALKLDARLANVITDQILTTLTFWLVDDVVRGDGLSEPRLIHKTVFQTMCLVVPYMGETGFDTLTQMIERYETAIA
jgi:AcrR family transcriptional regulator